MFLGSKQERTASVGRDCYELKDLPDLVYVSFTLLRNVGM